MLIHHYLRRSADCAPDDTAAIDAAGALTYGRLEAHANRLAHLLCDQGVKRGDRVVLALENSCAWVGWYFAILKAGAIAVPLPNGTKNDRLLAALFDCTPRVCVTDWATAENARGVLVACGVRVLLEHGVVHDADICAPAWQSLEEIAADFPETAPAVRAIDLDLAAIIYTSGSTGTPRGVMLSHLNIHSNTDSITSYLQLRHHDRVLVVLPLHYVYGLSLLQTHALVGGSVVFENRFAFPNAALRTINDHAVTGFAGVPSTFALLLHRSAVATMRFPSLRYVTQAGGPMPPALIRKWCEALPDTPLFVMYGATEAAARLSYLDPRDLDARIGSIGRAIPNVELRLLDDHNVEVRTGEVGEIVARGSNISNGYWNAPEETRHAFGPEGYHTGDLARADENGFLYVVGRTRDMLKVGAHRVGANEIEDVLHDHPDVHEAAVVGAAHELLGEAPVAFVSPRDGRSIEEVDIVAFCRSRLADYKVPTRVVVRAELPKGEAGKVDKTVLRACLDELTAAGMRSS